MATNLSSSKELTNSEDDDKNDEQRKIEEKESSLCPFKLAWSFGINPKTALINLTTKNRTIIAYACSHTIMIYNYKTKEAINLQGHQNAVAALSTTRDGKWLLSADFEDDCVVVVWDTESGVPVSTLFNPHQNKGMAAAEISPNAKYVVTVGTESTQKVYFWLWTYGRDEPDASTELCDLISDRVKKIEFNENFCEEFVLTASSNIVFCKREQNEIKSYTPKVLDNIRLYGGFNCSCFVSGSQRVLTATVNGYVLVWDIAVQKKPSKSKSQAPFNENERSHIKSVRLQKSNITAMVYHDRMIVLGTSEGRIIFYDLNLKILYWWKSDYLDSIQSISFDLTSALVGPVFTTTNSEFEFDEDDDNQYEEEEEPYWNIKLEDSTCDGKLEHMERIKLVKSYDEVSSTMTVYIEERLRNHNKNRMMYTKPPHMPKDATLKNESFYVETFCVSCSNGTVALIEIPTLKCEFILQNANIPVASLDAHPRRVGHAVIPALLMHSWENAKAESHYIVTGNIQGFVSLYNYKTHKLVVRKKPPPLPDFRDIIDKQVETGNIIYITCPHVNEKLVGITLVKYSPIADLLACGLENGTLWMLHPITLEPLDPNPYKHSTEAITKLAFTECAEYMAYADTSFVVAVFKRNRDSSAGPHTWNFLGSYRSHYAPIRDILFGPATTNSVVFRFFSLGEDRKLIEYDLKNSGPFPDPGLRILEIQKVECSAIPLCLAWYPQLSVEGFIMLSNSEYKYRLLNDMTKSIRGTFLGPLYSDPVKRFKVLSRKEFKGNTHMVFATEREIGLQILPFDGNPYKILGLIGHPRKVTNMCVNCDETILFTSGYNDPGILMWKIKCKSVDVLAQLGGEGLSPYYSLIEGGAKGWLANEMKDLFYYAQILQQGENTMAPRVISEKVDIKEIPNLMRAIGFYPSNEEIDALMEEVSYRNYAETGRLIDEITFEDFVKLYINHRPPFGISINHLLEAFRIFTNPNRIPVLDTEEPVLNRDQFVRILLGDGPIGFSKENGMPFGEPFTGQEAVMYLRFLLGLDVDSNHACTESDEKPASSTDFLFLPEMISYKDFIADIMGIELPEETRADDD